MKSRLTRIRRLRHVKLRLIRESQILLVAGRKDIQVYLEDLESEASLFHSMHGWITTYMREEQVQQGTVVTASAQIFRQGAVLRLYQSWNSTRYSVTLSRYPLFFNIRLTA